jgi:hypothetical protein
MRLNLGEELLQGMLLSLLLYMFLEWASTSLVKPAPLALLASMESIAANRVRFLCTRYLQSKNLLHT